MLQAIAFDPLQVAFLILTRLSGQVVVIMIVLAEMVKGILYFAYTSLLADLNENLSTLKILTGI